MVRTSTGHTKDAPPKKVAAPDDSRDIQTDLDLDDATWGRIQTMANSQQSTVAAVIKRAIEANYGASGPTSVSEVFNSGH